MRLLGKWQRKVNSCDNVEMDEVICKAFIFNFACLFVNGRVEVARSLD